MKNIKRIAVLAISLCFLLGTVTVYGYGHNLAVYSGNGSIDGESLVNAGTKTVDITTGTKATLTVGDQTYKVTPPSKKYFVRGLKVTGRDNDELLVGEQSAGEDPSVCLVGDQDTDIVVAYGLKSNMVSYTIRYQDQDGADLLDSETHYGAIGDKPIVSYKYVEDYLPNAYNATKTLTDDPDKNVFTFTYHPVEAAEGEGGNTPTPTPAPNPNPNPNPNPANPAAGGAAGGAAAPGAAAPGAAGDGGTAIGDNATPQADGPATIDDQDTPMAPGEEDEEGGSAMPYVIGGIVAAAIIALVAGLMARRRREQE